MPRPVHSDWARLHPERAKLPNTPDHGLSGYGLRDLLRPYLPRAVMHAKRTQLSDDTALCHVQWPELLDHSRSDLLRAKVSDLPGKYGMRAGMPDACYLSRAYLSHPLHRNRAELSPAHSGWTYVPRCKLHKRRAAVHHNYRPYLCWTTMLPDRNRPILYRSTVPDCGQALSVTIGGG